MSNILQLGEIFSKVQMLCLIKYWLPPATLLRFSGLGGICSLAQVWEAQW